MQSYNSPARKCAAILTAGVGAAVCLTSGHTLAAFKSGNISGSNSGKTKFVGGDYLRACENKAVWQCTNNSGPIVMHYVLGKARIHVTSSTIMPLAAGVVVSSALGYFIDQVNLPNALSDKYFAIHFKSPDLHYGWLHCVSINADKTELTVDRWGYETIANASCKTLADAVSVKKFSLASGQVKLVWANENEDGVARYEVQSKDAQGNWKSLDVRTPGDGSYSVNAPKDAACRLVIEGVDGATGQKDF